MYKTYISTQSAEGSITCFVGTETEHAPTLEDVTGWVSLIWADSEQAIITVHEGDNPLPLYGWEVTEVKNGV